MIENFIKFIINKNEEYVIFDIGSRDCLQSIEFYNTFPNAKIYAFECNPNTLDICIKNIENYVQDEIIINCHRLDTIIKKNNIDKVDIIWMDLQGAELLALKGLGSYLNRVKFIHTKVSYKEIYTGQVMFNELHNLIKGNDFK